MLGEREFQSQGAGCAKALRLEYSFPVTEIHGVRTPGTDDEARVKCPRGRWWIRYLRRRLGKGLQTVVGLRKVFRSKDTGRKPE